MSMLNALLLFLFVSASALGQPSQARVDSNALFAEGVVFNLPEAKFYLIGQLHNNEANIILEKELLFALNRRSGVTVDLI